MKQILKPMRINRLTLKVRTFMCLLIILFINSACASKLNTYYLVSARADGINVGSEIRSKGVVIGEVTNITFQNQKVLLTCVLEGENYLSVKSKFALQSADVFTTYIDVTNINVEPKYQRGDTIHFDLKREEIPIEKIDSMSMQLLDSIRQKLDKIKD